jgi:hypothetical protein
MTETAVLCNNADHDTGDWRYHDREVGNLKILNRIYLSKAHSGNDWFAPLRSNGVELELMVLYKQELIY